MSLLKDKIELDIAVAELETGKFLKGFPFLLRWIFILAVLSIIPAYFVAKSLSHKIWQERLRAFEISSRPSFKDPQAPKASPATVIMNRPGEYTAVAWLENQNLDLSVKRLSYEFRFYDSNNQAISAYPGSTFLLPNQKKYVIEPIIKSLMPISKAELIISEDIHWQKKNNWPDIRLTVSQPKGYQQASPPAFVVDGGFTNPTPYKLGSVLVRVVVKDSSGRVIAAASRKENDIVPNVRRDYKILWPNVVLPQVAKIEVEAETNVLDKENLGLPELPAAQDPAADLSRPEKRPYSW